MNRQRKILVTVTYNDLGIIVDTKAEVQPERKTGKWEKTITYYPYCSVCEWMPEEDEMTHGLYKYCPNCGAKMEVEHE